MPVNYVLKSKLKSTVQDLVLVTVCAEIPQLGPWGGRATGSAPRAMTPIRKIFVKYKFTFLLF